MSTDTLLPLFERERGRLHRIAYRMLGSFSEAEDIVQEAWLRVQRASGEIESPVAYLTRIVTRLCLDRLKSAQVRRDVYVGPWLPEPDVQFWEDPVEAKEEVTTTLMLAMERLSPLERAAFLLHDIFSVPLIEVAEALNRSQLAVRQLAVRARKRVRDDAPRYALERTEADALARAFFAATRDGDTRTLAHLLASNVQIRTDGGGKVLAFRNIVQGIDPVLRLFKSVYRKGRQAPTMVATAMVDGLPGYVSVDRENVLQTTALEVVDGKIASIYIVRNPDKLGHLSTKFPLLGVCQSTHSA